MHTDRCLIVKTDGYSHDEVAKVVQLRANVEGLKLGPGVLDKLAQRGDSSSLRYVLPLPFLNAAPFISVFVNPDWNLTWYPPLRYALQLLAPASILAGLQGRKQIELEDISEMGELFLDAKTSAEAIGKAGGGFDADKML